MPIAAVEGKKFSIADHDPKRNYVPSTIEESFYTGQVFNSNHQVLVIYTDGGPDHNVTFLKTQTVSIDKCLGPCNSIKIWQIRNSKKPMISTTMICMICSPVNTTDLL